MPSTADIHIQNIDPAPPEYIAVATPTMLPVPRQAASAEKSAPLWLTEPSPSSAGAGFESTVPPSHVLTPLI